MARMSRNRKDRQEGARGVGPGRAPGERRVETPRSDLFVLKIGERTDEFRPSPKERASGVVARVAKAMAKPGVTRAQIFRGAFRGVYAYSIYSQDPSKVVREDAAGRKILGRLVSGRFRPLSSGPAL
jgi:hypothetical protein